MVRYLHMKRFLISALGCAITFLPCLPVRAATLSPGDLIKASGPAVYYFAANGKRYVFPTDKTYFTWYSDFSSVKTITDSDLSAITIGGNVTYRPGVKLLKVTTDPRTYAVDAGHSLRWIKTEAIAKQLYGDNWAKSVDDLPDPFFVNYTVATPIETASDYVPATAMSASPTIQATLTASIPPTPPITPPTTPTSTPPTPPALSVSISSNKSTAQPDESIDLLAQTDYTGSIAHLDIYANGTLYNSCNYSRLCSATWVVPHSGANPTTTFSAKLTTLDNRTAEASTSTTIVLHPYSPFIQLTIDRAVIKTDQTPNIRSLILQGLTVVKNEIYIDGISTKVCTTTPNDCRYTDYVNGLLGSTHEIYSIVTTPGGLAYKSASAYLTIGGNDTPAVTIASGISNINSGQTVDVTMSANDSNGIDHMQIWNGSSLLKTCTGAAPCTVATGPWTLPSGSIISFTGVAFDMLGATGTAMTTVTIN
jgi:hypothetical protein